MTTTVSALGSSVYEVLGHFKPNIAFLKAFFSTWLKLDLTTLAAALTIFNTISGAAGIVKALAMKTYWYFTKFFTASISIAPSDKLNREILNWIGSQVLTRQGTRILTARTETIESNPYYFRRAPTERNDLIQEKRVPVQYLPTFGTTWFVFERRIFLVKRISPRNSAGSVPDEYAAAPSGKEPLVVMVLGSDVAPIKRFLDHCREFADKQREAYITVHASKSEYHGEAWDTTILRPIRPIETVHFDETTKSELVADIESYLDPVTRRFYNTRGIPYRRGYLFHGTPGTGKTSLSLALSGKFGLDLYLLHIPSIREDTELERLFNALPPRCIVLLEDIDAVGMRRQPAMGMKKEKGKKGEDGGEKDESEDESEDDSEAETEDQDKVAIRSRCTLSGLLNVLDGVTSQEGRIVIMTSNHAKKLDKALVRPGRIDRMILLDKISPRSAELMFLRMYAPDASAAPLNSPLLEDGVLEKLSLEFKSHIPDNMFTPAQLQGFLLNHRSSASAAARYIKDWVREEKDMTDEARQRSRQIAQWKKKNKKERALKALTSSVGVPGGMEARAAAIIRASELEREKRIEEKEMNEAIKNGELVLDGKGTGPVDRLEEASGPEVAVSAVEQPAKQMSSTELSGNEGVGAKEDVKVEMQEETGSTSPKAEVSGELA